MVDISHWYHGQSRLQWHGVWPPHNQHHWDVLIHFVLPHIHIDLHQPVSLQPHQPPQPDS